MSWVLIVGGGWLLLSFAAALVLGRAIWLAGEHESAENGSATSSATMGRSWRRRLWRGHGRAGGVLTPH